MAAALPPTRYAHFDRLAERNGPFTAEGFEPGQTTRAFLQTPILVLGAGGLGCEILKCLALTGFTNIDVIDMDTIDVSNLNRQFLFRQDDVGKPKAEVAARFVMRRCPGVTVTAHYCNMKELPVTFYQGFKVIIAGLDSIDARRWINSTICQFGLDQYMDPIVESIVPMIDGGTEGFKGHCRVIIPGVTPCFECGLDLFPPQTQYPLCTIADKPRLPEHCIEWGNMEFAHHHPGLKMDADEPEHLRWVFEAAKLRAAEFNIAGVTYQLVQGVVKNIIPAIASTNAVVAAACCNEAVKIATNIAGCLNNYMMYNGSTGIYTHTMSYQRKETCIVCGSAPIDDVISSTMTVFEYSIHLTNMPAYHMKSPTIYLGSSVLLGHGAFEETTRENLGKTMCELVPPNTVITVSDPGMPGDRFARFVIKYKD